MWSIFKNKEQRELEEQEKRIQEEKRKQSIKDEIQAQKNWKRLVKENYEAERKKYGYTKSRGVVECHKKHYYAFLSENAFRLFILPPPGWDTYDIPEGKMPQWKKCSINLSHILYFSREGEVYTETKVSGGGGGGSDIGGAIIGGIIAGAPGAVIASRGKSQPIKSETVKHDTRKTILVYKGGKLEFAPEDYDVLMRLIPEKEISVVKQQKAMEAASQRKPDTVESRLERLETLKAKDLISEDEYQTKRQSILDEL